MWGAQRSGVPPRGACLAFASAPARVGGLCGPRRRGAASPAGYLWNRGRECRTDGREANLTVPLVVIEMVTAAQEHVRAEGAEARVLLAERGEG